MALRFAHEINSNPFDPPWNISIKNRGMMRHPVDQISGEDLTEIERGVKA